MTLAYIPPQQRENETLVTERPSEDTKIFSWRMDCLVRAGYDLEAAWLIAQRHDVDLRQAVSLLEQGCSVNTALLILL